MSVLAAAFLLGSYLSAPSWLPSSFPEFSLMFSLPLMYSMPPRILYPLLLTGALLRIGLWGPPGYPLLLILLGWIGVRTRAFLNLQHAGFLAVWFAWQVILGTWLTHHNPVGMFWTWMGAFLLFRTLPHEGT